MNLLDFVLAVPLVGFIVLMLLPRQAQIIRATALIFSLVAFAASLGLAFGYHTNIAAQQFVTAADQAGAGLTVADLANSAPKFVPPVISKAHNLNLAMLPTSAIESLAAPPMLLVALTSSPLTSIQKLATASRRLTAMRSLFFWAIEAFEKSRTTIC